MSEKHYQVLVTRDTSESALIPIKADNAKSAADLATARETAAKYGHFFAANDGGSEAAPYLGDPDEDVEPISEAQYQSLVSALESIPAPTPPKLTKPFDLVIKVNVADEFAEGPEYAVITVNQVLIDNLLRLRDLCKQNNLEHAAVRYCAVWEREEEYRLRGEGLRVTNYGKNHSFQVEGYMKFSGIIVETHSIDIDQLLTLVFDKPQDKAFNDFARSDGRLFYSHDECGRGEMIDEFEKKDDE